MTFLNTPENEAPNSLFSRQQWQRLFPCLSVLNEEQRLWLSGFLAAGRLPAGTSETSASENTNTIWVAYGGETGNSELVASRLSKRLDKNCVPHQLVSLAEIKPRALARVNYLVIICSTHGDGDPPEACTAFFEALFSSQQPNLSRMSFAVLALGDSSYEKFCTAGKKLDSKLAQLGAERLTERLDCDVDFEKPADEWIARLVSMLPQAKPPTTRKLKVVPQTSEQQHETNRREIVSAEVLDSVCLSGPGRACPIHHIELLVEADLGIEPGDAIGIYPQNPPELVNTILNLGGFSGEELVKVQSNSIPLVEVLREHVDICIPGVSFLKCWAAASDSKGLQKLSLQDRKSQQQYLRTLQLADILRAYPGGLEAQIFVDNLRPLQPRLYDVANDVSQGSDELHVTVKKSQFILNEKQYTGIASQYLLELQPGEALRLYAHHNKRFRLPEKEDVPIILVAQSTGIAPFRAFLQYLAHKKRNNPVWLIFQEQSREEDFLYQLDLQKAASQNLLEQVDTVFVADDDGLSLNAIFERRFSQLRDWIAKKSHIYLCGERPILTDCEIFIGELLKNKGCSEMWNQLIQEKRLHRNVY